VDPATASRDALAERLFQAAVATMDLYGVYLGDRLGLYRALADRGASTSGELADDAQINERYAREWLEQQAAAGILTVDDADAAPEQRRFALPPGHDEVLLDETSLSFGTSLAQSAVVYAPVDELVDAFRSGEGLTSDRFGPEAHLVQARSTRALFENLLGSEWLPAIPDVHERLTADPPARVADVACGCGWSSIAIARAYPKVSVDGIDLDEASIEQARLNLAGTDVTDRVRFHNRDAAGAEFAHSFELVTIFEALHDMSRPVDVLEKIRVMLADDGSVLIADERTADSFRAPASDLERLYYGFSILTCLPSGMVGPDAAGTGTVMRADTLRRYATEAGFSDVEVLPIEHDFWRFYLLRDAS
jgi:2-polyprenyl-3-methyl-5-hydroxy-6-metoxy-1,4-benzoquinol methylase